ncbi:MAG: peptidase M16 [Alphaproteobacteria bacterium CG11_big_fil_rev_8_21_14_0_20_39_49]|nr:MAG: peptidase M16 [Alphaproteobacteria bacterium CG11_big_fil_rev_8_21_14_0_20_39_49]
MKKIFSFIIIILLGFYPKVSIAKSFGAKGFTLDNGMQVVVIPNTKVSAVSHMVWYKIGAVDEPLGKSGIAHFLEHLMFKGTTRYGKGEFSKTIAKSGGDDNAFTGYDYTAYFQNISRDKLELVMDMESDRMENLILDEKEVLTERDVILEERSARVDNKPSSVIAEQMRAALYRNHPYGTPLIGWRHEIAALTPEDAQNWYDKYYAPNNAVLVVSGDITEKELKPLAEKYYGKIKTKKTPQRIMVSEPTDNFAAINISLADEKVTRPEWSRYYIAPSLNTDEKGMTYPLVLLSYILAESDTGRLYQNLVVEQEIAVSVSGYYNDLQLGESFFGIYAIPSDKSNIEQIEKEIEKQIENIKQNGVTEDELKRAKNALIAETIYAREDLKTLAYLYGQMMATGVGMEYADNWEKNIEKVTAKQVQDAAMEVLQIDRSVTGYLTPKG